MILGVVGSPRKRGLNNQLITRVLEGAKSAEVKTEKVYLVDFKVPESTKKTVCVGAEIG